MLPHVALTVDSEQDSAQAERNSCSSQGDGGLKGFGLQLLGSSQTRLFILHSALLLLGLGVVQPLSGLLSYRAWRWFLAISVLSHGYKVCPSQLCIHPTSIVRLA